MFLLPLLTALVTVSSGQADASTPTNSPIPAQYLTARWVNAIARCTLATDDGGSPALKESLDSSEYARMDIFRTGEGNKGRLTVGHDLEYSGGVSGDDGVVACEELVVPGKSRISEAFGSTSDFIDLFYDKVGSQYNRKDETERIKASEKLLASLFVGAADTGDIEKIRYSIAFAECFKESTDGTSDISGLSKDYKYVNGKDDGSNIPVGIGDIEKVTCSRLASRAQSGNLDLITFMSENNVTTSILRNNPQNLYANIRASNLSEVVDSAVRGPMLSLLNSNPDIIKFCTAAASLPVIGTDSIAEWLISGEIKDNLVYTGAGSSTIEATSEQANTLKTCLLSDPAFGTSLKSMLSQLGIATEGIADDLTNNTGTSSSSSSASEADACLSSDDFLGWFVCPVIDKIISFTEVLQGTIETALKFKVDEIGTSTEGAQSIKDSWNIFRSLGTILLIIGFLIALLVKAIKG